MNRTANGAASGARLSAPMVSESLIRAELAAQRLSGAVGRVAVVTAPAGYGKTSQVAAWAQADGRPTAWVELDHSHNDHESFLALVLDMLDHVAGVVRNEFTTPALDVGDDEAMVASALGALVHNCVEPFVLVFDDAHNVDQELVTDLLLAVLENVPPHSTVVLVGRTAPHVTLARLRAYARLVDVSMQDLSLDEDGARRLLECEGVTVADACLQQLVEQTEGWPVGMRLTASTVGSDSGSCHWSVGHDHVVADFIREEWLRGVPDEAIEFLTSVSGLDELTAPMCDAVLERNDSSEMLRFWESTMLLIPLDARHDSFRIHRVLRDVLYDGFDRRDTTGRRRVDLRASAWFERAGDVDTAIRLSVRAGRVDRAVQLVDVFAPRSLAAADHSTVQRWMRSLSTETTIASATLCVTASAHALVAGDPESARQWLRFADEAVRSGSHAEGDPLRLASLRALLSQHVDRRALDQARHAYEHLPPGEWHAVACFGYGALSSMLGDDETALGVLAEGAVEARILHAASTEAQCLAGQAAIIRATDWAGARRLTLSARSVQRARELDDLPQLVIVTAMSALVEARSGTASAARDDIAAARRSLERLAPLAGWANIRARLILSEAALLLGDRVTARSVLDEVEPMVRDNPAAVRSAEQFEHLAAQLHAGRATLPHGPSSLTAAELRLLSLLPTNLTLADIAKQLFVSRNTAKSHAAAIYRKLGVSTRGEAVQLARNVGLLAGAASSSAVERRSTSAVDRDELFEYS